MSSFLSSAHEVLYDHFAHFYTSNVEHQEHASASVTDVSLHSQEQLIYSTHHPAFYENTVTNEGHFQEHPNDVRSDVEQSLPCDSSSVFSGNQQTEHITTETTNSVIYGEHQVGDSSERNSIFQPMLTSLLNDTKACSIHDWSAINMDDFSALFSSKDLLSKSFQKYELLLCCESIKSILQEQGFSWTNKFPKYKMVEILKELTNRYLLPTPSKNHCPTQKSRKQTRSKSKSVFETWPKVDLAIVVAELQWHSEITKWNSDAYFAKGIRIFDKEQIVTWFSKPCTDSDGKVRFHFTDACHILTCLRTKLCTTGINGLRRKAWEIAALSPTTKLNISVVIDCVDKQDVSLARRMFALDVENAMPVEYKSEAEFCRLLRNWFDAEDEPGISVDRRCQYRLDMRNWLLASYPIGKFPPATRYVRGIPIVSYEALVLIQAPVIRAQLRNIYVLSK